ncbi:MAG: nuclear transport factor 2 family protein [Gemmatimonadaceae bacterium]
MRIPPIAIRVSSVAIALALFAIALSAGAQTPAAPPAGAPRSLPGANRQVVAAVRALFDAAERNDMPALDTLYAGERLTVVEGAGINRGWADYRDHHLAPEMKSMKNFKYRPFEIEGEVSGDLAWSMFRYALQADADGRPVDVVGRGTAILEHKGGRWVVRHTQTTSRPRRPADPPMPQ